MGRKSAYSEYRDFGASEHSAICVENVDEPVDRRGLRLADQQIRITVTEGDQKATFEFGASTFRDALDEWRTLLKD